MNLVEQVRRAGVVGAGGGGFPTHVKLAAKADTVIANGAECEPLLHKDAVVMEHQAAQIVQGMRLAMEAVGARTGIVGIKAKNRHAVAAVEAACRTLPDPTPDRIQGLVQRIINNIFCDGQLDESELTPSLASVRYFRPNGETDADYETYKEYL